MDVFNYLFVVMVVAALRHSSVDAQGVPPFGVQAIRDNWKLTLIVTFSFLFVAFIFFLVFRFQSPRSSHECKNEDTPNNKVIENCPIFVYATAKELKLGNEAMECTVCLSQFQDKDTVKMLPKCAHVFHQQCIDNWLPSHMTCPICRQNLTSDSLIDTHNPFNDN